MSQNVNKYCDEYAWNNYRDEDKWIYDKLLLSKKLGYRCGPVGVDVDRPDTYVVRPCVNLMGMGRGAFITHIEKTTDDLPEGMFWCEMFKGRHLSVDYVDGEQVLCVEGIRDSEDPLWKWKEWRKVEDKIPLPDICKTIQSRYINVEMIDGNVIEVHQRLNPDWKNTPARVKALKPCYSTEDGMVDDADYKRIGFITIWE